MNINFENSFLYAFSAIPQVLSGLIALLGVFLLFKFQSLKRSLISFGEQTLDRLNHEEFLRSINDSELQQLKGWLKEGIIRQDDETVVSQLSGINQRLHKLNKERTFVKNDHTPEMAERHGVIETFKISENIMWDCLETKDNLVVEIKGLIIHCVTVVVLSIGFLPLVPLFHNTNLLLLLFLLFGVVAIWFCMCLIKIVRVSLISMTHDYNDGKKEIKKLGREFFESFKIRKKSKYKRPTFD